MATVTHYIYSHYDPKERDRLERETGQIPESKEDEIADLWQTESVFGARSRLANPPRFVPAIVSYDEINNMMGTPTVAPEPKEAQPTNEVSSWYRSITRTAPPPGQTPELLASAPVSLSTLPAPQPAQTGSSSFSTPHSLPPPSSAKRSNNDDWFISRALRSEPPIPSATPAQTLADILLREPPPQPSERPYMPPVFLALGPSNKGFAMLQQSGWSEGEPLGKGVARRALSRKEMKAPQRQRPEPEEPSGSRLIVKEEVRDLLCDPDGEITEVRKVDVIDLTLSSDEEEGGTDGDADVQLKDEPSPKADDALLAQTDQSYSEDDGASSSHNPRALITPLPTVLKSDRLGVGLKAKTVGPYKASKKRVTHNAAALAAHIRETEEMRRMKSIWGRGTRGFARQAKVESETRQRLLASLNEG